MSLPKISAPATRALASAGITTIEDLSKFTEAEVMALHGMGPHAMRILKEMLGLHGLSFKKEPT